MWSAGVANAGHFVLHGTETCYYPDGIKQREAHFKLGKKLDQEAYWNPAGQMLWSWNYSIDGSSVWTQYWPNGSKKSESSWRGLIAKGEARRWDPAGKLLEELKFSGGKIKN